MATITIEISDEMLKEAFNMACEEYAGKSKLNDEQMEAFVDQVASDFKDYVCGDLMNFFQEGINNDLYQDFIDFDEGDDD